MRRERETAGDNRRASGKAGGGRREGRRPGRRKGLLRALLFLGAAGAFGLLFANLMVVGTTAGQIVTPQEAAGLQADCILVLGAGVRDDGTPSRMLSDRLTAAAGLYEDGVSGRLLMSGDHGRSDYDEVNAMKDAAVAAGIPSEAVFMDHAGFSTYDSLYRARDIFQAERVVIVTQRYHLYRALYIARALGLEAVGVAAFGDTYGGQAYREAREAIARVKDFLTAFFKPQPRILGEAVPVSGNGDVTNDRDRGFPDGKR